MEFKYFKKEEFECSCCQQNSIKSDFINKLDVARYLAKTPFRILSGYRCPKHNESVGGSPNSAHLTGYAADIFAGNSRQMYMILNAVMKAGFTRIGINNNSIHVDMADAVNPEIYKPDLVWDYY